ncbi:MAG: tetratricopeptide repeat protein [Calditrichota bacterium]
MKFHLIATIILLFTYSVIAEYPAAADSLLKKASDLHMIGETDSAIVVLEDFCTEFPDHAYGHYYLGRILYDLDENEQAEKILKKAVELNSQESYYQLWLGRAYVKNALDSNIFRKTLYARKIKKCFLNAVELDSLNTIARHDLIQFYVLVPRIAGGSDSKALEHADILKRQNTWEGFKAFGTIYSLQKDFTKAEEEYLAALAHYPRDIQFYNYLASVYEKVQQYDKIIELYTKAEQKLPEFREEILQKKANAFAALQKTQYGSDMDDNWNEDED